MTTGTTRTSTVAPGLAFKAQRLLRYNQSATFSCAHLAPSFRLSLPGRRSPTIAFISHTIVLHLSLLLAILRLGRLVRTSYITHHGHSAVRLKAAFPVSAISLLGSPGLLTAFLRPLCSLHIYRQIRCARYHPIFRSSTSVRTAYTTCLVNLSVSRLSGSVTSHAPCTRDVDIVLHIA